MQPPPLTLAPEQVVGTICITLYIRASGFGDLDVGVMRFSRKEARPRWSTAVRQAYGTHTNWSQD